jgi:SpoIIAA-like
MTYLCSLLRIIAARSGDREWHDVFATSLGSHEVSVIERLRETGGIAFGFKVIGKLSEEELAVFEQHLECFFAQHKNHPIGILADLTHMRGAEWTARWEELRFLTKASGRVARTAVVGASQWEELVHRLIVGAALLQSEVRYFKASEIRPAWQWVKTRRQTGDASGVNIWGSNTAFLYWFYWSSILR